MKNITTIKVPKKYQHMIEDIYLDGEGSGYWVHAKEGYYFAGFDYGVHIVRESTQKEILDQIRQMKPCDCEDCVKGE